MGSNLSEFDQLLLDLGGAPSLTRDDLIVSSSNLDAVSLVDRWPDWNGPFAVLVGPKGCGKTHLAEIWTQRAGAYQLDLDALGGDDLDAAQAGRCIAIDGLTQERLDETHLFHLMNSVRNARSYMLLTSETPMEYWPIKTADLMSRIKSATTVTISPPDDILLAGVISKLFSDRQIEVHLSVIQYIAQRIERSLDVAIQLVERLDKIALVNKTSVTKPLVKQLLDDLQNGQLNIET
jgi:chromosomal replication initiation ATPase DnaA